MTIELNKRAKEILRLVVDAYVDTGAPVGSKTISERLGMSLSPATIRNVMASLEAKGLLYAPHTSAGRMPTDAGMTVFVEGLLEVGKISKEDIHQIEKQFGNQKNHAVTDVLEKTSTMLSGLSSCAGLVLAPKYDRPLKQIEFIRLSENKILVILVDEGGNLQNRVIETTEDFPPSSLQMAANYLNERLVGKNLSDAHQKTMAEIKTHKAQLDKLTAKLVEQGLASCLPEELGSHLIIKGQSKLLDDVAAIEDLARVRELFDVLENQETILKLLQSTQNADGIQIFIGSGNDLFDLSGCSLVLSPYKNNESTVVGAIGVIGPSRLNYGRIIPIVDYTSQLISKIID